ncbi:hypothetical protein ACW6AV_000616, partial [Edwardsiella piscicida]
MSQVDKQALREELSNQSIGSNAHLRKLALALLDENEALAAENADLKHPGTYLPSKITTTETDAFINEMMAQGVEMLAKKCSENVWCEDDVNFMLCYAKQ